MRHNRQTKKNYFSTEAAKFLPKRPSSEGKTTGSDECVQSVETIGVMPLSNSLVFDVGSSKMARDQWPLQIIIVHGEKMGEVTHTKERKRSGSDCYCGNHSQDNQCSVVKWHRDNGLSQQTLQRWVVGWLA